MGGNRIVIGITGGIAAYKSPHLVRLFKSNGYEVKVAATRHALEFVTPLTLETLSQNRLYADMFGPAPQRDVHHVSLADWADGLVVAPATADIIGKFAHGIADDALSTLLLATRKPVFIAPAMNDKMYREPTVQANIGLLRQKGCHVIGPASGFLACGSAGEGRMEEPEEIFRVVHSRLNGGGRLAGKKALVTAGPTHEPIDPVRYIGNHSSGLMGFCLAETAAAEGAEVTLITGPTRLTCQHPGIRRVDVTTASEMFQQCLEAADQQDLIIMAAAVADFTPEQTAAEKIKKDSPTLDLHLVRTRDILATIGQRKRPGQVLVGFALETEHEVENATRKLHTKNADLIVLNSLRDTGAGFGTPTNKVRILFRDGQVRESELKDKRAIAGDILDAACSITL